MTKFQENVLIELQAIADAGMKVPRKAVKIANDDIKMAEHEESMSVSDCASIIIELALT